MKIKFLFYQFGVESKRNCCEQTENVAHEDEVVAAGVRVLDDTAVVKLVVDDDQDDGHDDPDYTDNDHGNVQAHGHSLDICFDDCSVLRRVSFRPPN